MPNPLRSINDMLAQQNAGGSFMRLITNYRNGTTTAATATSGYNTVQAFDNTLTMPNLGAGYNYWWFTHISSWGTAATAALCGLRTIGGTLSYTASTPTFTAGTAMPSRPFYDATTGGSTSPRQLASPIPILVIGATGTITTPTVTITYVDQDGNGGNNVAATLPTSPTARSAFFLHPHMTTDRGIREITNITSSVAPTTWSIEVHLVYPLYLADTGVNGLGNFSPSIINNINPRVGLQGGDVLGFYNIGTNASSTRQWMLFALGDS